MSWLESLPHAQREVVYTEMRSLRAKSTAYLEESARLQPRYGEIAVGGRHIDALARGEALAVLLRGLGQGLTPEQARFKAGEEAALIFNKWNTSRKDFQVHRNLDGLGSMLDAVQRTLEALGK